MLGMKCSAGVAVDGMLAEDSVMECLLVSDAYDWLLAEGANDRILAEDAVDGIFAVDAIDKMLAISVVQSLSFMGGHCTYIYLSALRYKKATVTRLCDYTGRGCQRPKFPTAFSL
ncbi:Hypothetical predicted protein [Pelobates cultripes]|uniref:Uncharacterized protein n=1 Tax=Pelobates cultripes TaxID=61616 RepID=A0AAD1SZ38_PELCU|nr:Hypothetical predicted protein [Pelobates cultripes]